MVTSEDGGPTLSEPDITINGHKLSFAQAMTVRVALSNFGLWLADDASAALNPALRDNYRAHVTRVGLLMLSAPVPDEALVLEVRREGPLVTITSGDGDDDLREGVAAAAGVLVGTGDITDPVRLAAAALVSAIRHPPAAAPVQE